MGNILAYSGIVTKIRAMEAKLLSPKQFEEISAMKSVPEVAAYLMEKILIWGDTGRDAAGNAPSW